MILIALLLTAACSDPAPQETPTPQTSRIQETALPPSSAAPPRDTSRPGEIVTFRDWVVGCDNGLDCIAAALAPDEMFDPGLLLSIERRAGPFGTTRIKVSGPGDPVAPLTLSVDGKQVARGGVAWDDAVVLGGPETARMAAVLANGSRATIASGGQSFDVSLDGASAALRWMDDRQGRAGTETAIVARGPGTATIVPNPAIPVVSLPAIDGTPVDLTPDLLASMREQGGCTAFEDEYGSPEVHALGEATSVVSLPCHRGAYNAINAIFLVDADGARPAPFDAATAMRTDNELPALVNARFEDGVFDSDAKGRGLGDCGITQRFGWDGTRFRLLFEAEMPECRGSMERIPTFRAQVERGTGE